jgi:hypothetical protein
MRWRSRRARWGSKRVSIVRKAFSTILFIFAALLVFAMHLINDDDLAHHSFENSQIIQQEFEKIGNFTESFREIHGSLPQLGEFENWYSRQNFKVMKFNDQNGAPVFLSKNGESCGKTDASENLEFWAANKNHYALCFWRGEWFEAYVPQSRQSTLPKSIDEYRLSWGGLLIWLALIGISCFLAWLVGFSKRLDRGFAATK